MNDMHKSDPCLICNRKNHTTTQGRITAALNVDSQICDCPQRLRMAMIKQSSITTSFNPIFVKVICNNTSQEALIDTGSVIIIIH